MGDEQKKPPGAFWAWIALAFLAGAIVGMTDVCVPVLGVAFAAFCVWLAVRIINRRERWAMWTAVGAVALALLYVLSSGPMMLLAFGPPHIAYAPNPTGSGPAMAETVIDIEDWWARIYAPLSWASEQSWGQPISFYWEFFSPAPYDEPSPTGSSPAGNEGGRMLILVALAIAFVAFCVWLTVRIIYRRERWAKWTAVAVVIVFVIYPLSTGPAVWFDSRGMISKERSNRIFGTLYAPVVCVARQSVVTTRLWAWYTQLWRGHRALNP